MKQPTFEETVTRVANYLDKHNIITVLNSGSPDTSQYSGRMYLEFRQYLRGGIKQICRIVYDARTGVIDGDAPDVKECSPPTGFVENVRKPIEDFFWRIDGIFYSRQLEPIHAACERVTTRHASE